MSQTDQEKEQQEQQPQQQPQQEEQQQQQQPAVEADQKETQDKKDIADEEREKMLNAENTKHTGAAPQAELEAEERKPKRKIPIGAIKMPGFCRSKSKEPCKEEETKPSENADGEAAKDGVEADKAGNGSTPSKEPRDNSTAVQRSVRFMRSLGEGPLANVRRVLNRSKKESDAELGHAGLAHIEALEEERNNAAADDGMENVRLDVDGPDSPPVKLNCCQKFAMTIKKHIWYNTICIALLVLCIIIICSTCLGPRPPTRQPIKDGKVTTQTQCGLVEGLIEEDAFVFRGIPYARPPVDDLRWKPTEKLSKLEHCWNGTYLAHNASESCWQRTANNSISGSEDCLYLDIYTPQVTYERPLSVVVMIGADTLSGPSPGIMIPSGKLSRVRDIVFVRPNFRLDVFGFLAVEPLSRAAHPTTSGNYGLHDIISVLEWVKLNIQHFGGDNTKITLWGHRAGGTLVTALVGSRKAKNLFQRAWISSGSIIFPTVDREHAEKENKVFLDITKCKDAACLKSLNAKEVMEMVPPMWFTTNDGLPNPREFNSKKREWLVKDDIIIQQHIGEAFAQNNGENRQVLPKIVMGTTAQSGQLPKEFNYNATFSNNTIVKALQDSLIGTTGNIERALAQYNATVKGLHTLISDIRVTCPLMTLATARNDIPFYIVTFPREADAIVDVDSDAAAILGFFPMKTAEQKRHLQAIQTLFNHFVWHGEVKEFEPSKRIFIVDQDVLPRAGYDNCKLWIEQNIVPAFARVD